MFHGHYLTLVQRSKEIMKMKFWKIGKRRISVISKSKHLGREMIKIFINDL